MISIAIYTSLGHRWRIVVLLLSQILLWFFVRGKRPSITVLSISLVILLVFSTIVEQTRSYGAGLSLSKVSRLSSEDLLQNRLQESNVFLVTGGLIASLPDNNEYVGFAPIISTALFPIPSAFWPEKNSFFYLSNSISNLFRNSLFGIGQAVLNYAEYYLMFGWPSLVIAGFLSGFLLRTLWNWFSIRRYETIAQVTYIATCAFLYMWISRGYLPQFILTLSFGSLPLFWYYYKHSRPAPTPKTASRSRPVFR